MTLSRFCYIHSFTLLVSAAVAMAQKQPVPAIAYSEVQQLLEGDSDEVIVEKAAKLLPRPNQVAWQRKEMTFFVCIGPNTFTGVEWGTGNEPPSVFNPTALDAGQWVREIKQAGGKMVVFVVKHHEGFCLWPSRYTAHDVEASPWLGGKGDLVRQVSAECRAQGLNFGVYLSPADLFQIKSPTGYYGKKSSVQPSVIPSDPASFSSDPMKGRTPPEGMPIFKYNVDDYNRYFLNQLYELLTEYGPIHEVWFDGANPHSGTSQSYDRSAWFDLIRRLRPEAVIAVKGPDVRWVGNEKGISRVNEWSPVPIPVAPENHTWGDMTSQDLGSRSKLKRGSYLTWYPAEADVPLLHGWFWAPKKLARTSDELVNIYFASVGRNSNLLLNVSPDDRGLIPDNQLAPLRAFSQVIRQTFTTSLSAGVLVKSDAAKSDHPANLANDSNLDTWWEAPACEASGSVVLQFAKAETFDVISLQEAIAQRGQRIESIALDTWESNGWVERATAGTIGHKRLIKLASPVTSDRLRVRILQSRLEPTLAEISVHRLAEQISVPVIHRDRSGRVNLTASKGDTIRYTLDGSDPLIDSPVYRAPFELPQGGEVRAIAWRGEGMKSLTAIQRLGIAPVGWTATASSSAGSNSPALAIDGDPATLWQSANSANNNEKPWLVIDLGETTSLGGFVYLPRQDGSTAGIIRRYLCESSEDGMNWNRITEGVFDNIINNPQEQRVVFKEPVKARWLRLTSMELMDKDQSASAAEIGVLSADRAYSSR